MQRLPILIVTLTLSACTPHSAEITSGTFTAFVSDDTSLSILNESIVPAKDYEDSYFTIDCRTFEDIDPNLSKEEIDFLRIGTAEGKWADLCDKKWPVVEDAPAHEEWLLQSPFWVVTEELDPWRGEAIITSEGDLQIGFHHRLKGGADFRFAFVIDPDFQPKRCEESGDGVEAVDYDGNWIDEWSKELDWLSDEMGVDAELAASYAHYTPYLDGQLFLLNAYGYQVNWYAPSCTFDGSVDNCYWYLPEPWQAGYGQGKFADEEFFTRSPRWGEPAVYNFLDQGGADAIVVEPSDLWYCDPEPATEAEWSEPRQAICGGSTPTPTYGELIDHVEEVAFQTGQEAARVNVNPVGNENALHIRPFVVDNTWRLPDGKPEDFDGWTEIHYNSVVFSADSVLEEGGSAKGAFTLVYDGLTSLSRFVIQGEFVVDKIRKDHWVTEDLRSEKAAEAGYDYDATACTIL